LGCHGGSPADPPVGDGGLRILGPTHNGSYNLGPVEWSGSFTNACAPYASSIQGLEGDFLAGLSNQVAGDGSYCDACVYVKTGAGKELVARVVTYGVSNAPDDMDLSQAAYQALSTGEYPRSMSWNLVECPTTAPAWIQFQTASNPYWTSLWVRNPREAVNTVEATSANHATWHTLTRGTDGTFTDNGGFGSGAFTLRVTGIDGAQVSASFPSFSGGDLVSAGANLP
jgi:expansin (peptidoglycan-binding protein)